MRKNLIVLIALLCGNELFGQQLQSDKPILLQPFQKNKSFLRKSPYTDSANIKLKQFQLNNTPKNLFSHTTPMGNVYTLHQDNMPCLVPFNFNHQNSVFKPLSPHSYLPADIPNLYKDSPSIFEPPLEPIEK